MKKVIFSDFLLAILIYNQNSFSQGFSNLIGSSGMGVCYVHIVDGQGTVIEKKKIVLQ
jgi:hypothetical protein